MRMGCGSPGLPGALGLQHLWLQSYEGVTWPGISLGTRAQTSTVRGGFSNSHSSFVGKRIMRSSHGNVGEENTRVACA